MRAVLEAVPGWTLSQIKHLNRLATLDLSRFQAMVLYYHHEGLDGAALAAFEGFVAGGGGVLALHSATASFKEEGRYTELLGGRFAGHGPVERFEVQPAAPAEAVFGDIGPFTVKDELYLHDLQPDLDVHFTAQYGGKPQPLVWTRQSGEGRVCCFGPGHRTETMKQPQVQQLLREALAWILREEGL